MPSATNRLRPVAKLMFIFPPYYHVKNILPPMVCPPLGVAYLAAFVRDMVDVALLDCVVEGARQRRPTAGKMEIIGLSPDEIVDRVRRQAPDMVGISCIFSNQFPLMRQLTDRIKSEIDKDIVIVTGGTHPSFLPEQTLEKTGVDYVVLGEGELGLRAIIDAHNGRQNLEAVDGIAYRDGDRICVRPRESWIESLDDLPFPARELLPMEKYFKALAPMAYFWRKIRNTPLISSRGCPYRCPFCSSWRHWGGRFRKRSAENVLAEIEHLKERYDVQELKWQDDNLTLDRQRAVDIFRGMTDRGLVMPWNTPNGLALWTVDDELLGLMKKSGCYQITIAVESGDPVSFERYVKKPFSLDRAVETARLARRHGISTVGYFIIGFPEESMRQIENSLRFGQKIGVDYLVPFVYTPLPGSELWRYCLERGIISDDYAYEIGNDFYQSALNVASIESARLQFMQGKTYFQNLLKLPFRNPREFFSWYGRQLLLQPYAVKQFVVNVLRTVSLAWRGKRTVFLKNRHQKK